MPRYKTETTPPQTVADCLRHLAQLAQLARARATPEGAIVWAQAELELAGLISSIADQTATKPEPTADNAAPHDN